MLTLMKDHFMHKRPFLCLLRCAAGLCCFMAATTGAHADSRLGYNNVRDYIGKEGRSSYDHTESIQAAIDAAANRGGGVVYFPPGVYRLSGPLRLPRGVVVQLRGAGPGRTMLYAYDELKDEKGTVRRFPEGRAVIEWQWDQRLDPTLPLPELVRRYRSLREDPNRPLVRHVAATQSIVGLTFRLPPVDQAMGIHFKPYYKVLPPHCWSRQRPRTKLEKKITYSAAEEGDIWAERLRIELRDLEFRKSHCYHRYVIRLEGDIISSTIENIESNSRNEAGHEQKFLRKRTVQLAAVERNSEVCLPEGQYELTFAEIRYPTVLLKVDDWLLGNAETFPYTYLAMENGGLNFCLLRQLFAGGGYNILFEGRMLRSVMELCFVDGSWSEPCYRFTNCFNTIFRQLGSEGRSERCQFLFENCVAVTVEHFNPSRPDQIYRDKKSAGRPGSLVLLRRIRPVDGDPLPVGSKAWSSAIEQLTEMDEIENLVHQAGGIWLRRTSDSRFVSSVVGAFNTFEQPYLVVDEQSRSNVFENFHVGLLPNQELTGDVIRLAGEGNTVRGFTHVLKSRKPIQRRFVLSSSDR